MLAAKPSRCTNKKGDLTSLAGAPFGKWPACLHTGFYFKQQNCPTPSNRVNSTSCVADRSAPAFNVWSGFWTARSILVLLTMVKRSTKSPSVQIQEPAQCLWCALAQKFGLAEMHKWPQSERSWSLRGFQTQRRGRGPWLELAVEAALAPSPGQDRSRQTSLWRGRALLGS